MRPPVLHRLALPGALLLTASTVAATSSARAATEAATRGVLDQVLVIGKRDGDVFYAMADGGDFIVTAPLGKLDVLPPAAAVLIDTRQ